MTSEIVQLIKRRVVVIERLLIPGSIAELVMPCCVQRKDIFYAYLT